MYEVKLDTNSVQLELIIMFNKGYKMILFLITKDFDNLHYLFRILFSFIYETKFIKY